MKFFADLHIHSKYSRATSPDMDLDHIAEWAKYKGLNLVGTGDFTHPAWFKELKFKLEPRNNGLYHYKGVDFILTAEVNNIFTKHGKVRKIHNLVVSPSLAAVEELNRHLRSMASLDVDGRPILPIFASRLVELVMKADPANFVVPAHIWTPHFSLFGSNSGFDSVEDCFEDQTEQIFAMETGLSSDPPMNWRLSALDKYTLVSNSD
ncbi:MAG TPA: endonuclease Q family protein, partial [Candidatus Edwardsbacteria bacterium]|nr:endonuclease Q family protein [Candidatus Edwardsbacteria bacterium]